MLNFIWGFFIICAIIISAFTGRIAETANAVFEGGKSAVNLAITMLGVVSVWTGVMRIAEKGGLIDILAEKSAGIISWLFPDLPKRCAAVNYIAANFAANFLGLGWAATPAGLLAMDELNKLNPKKGTASRSMRMFIVVNTSSLQLITVNIIAYRAEYGSANPSETVFAGIIATLVSTASGVLAAKLMERRR